MCNIEEITKIYKEAYLLRNKIIEIRKLMFDDYINDITSNMEIYHNKINKCLQRLLELKYKLIEATNNNPIYIRYIDECYNRYRIILYRCEQINYNKFYNGEINDNTDFYNEIKSFIFINY